MIEFLPVFLIVACLVLGTRLIAGSMDSDRIEEYVRMRGWTLIERSWEPFGPGWFGEKSDRIYRIVYRDQDGQLHEAHAKTSALSGVYLTQTKAYGDVKTVKKDRVLELEEENARLRERLNALEDEPS